MKNTYILTLVSVLGLSLQFCSDHKIQDLSDPTIERNATETPEEEEQNPEKTPTPEATSTNTPDPSEVSITLTGRQKDSGSFVANGVSIPSGQAAQIQWQTTGNPTSCTLFDVTTFPPTAMTVKPLETSTFETPVLTSARDYEMRCDRDGMPVTASYRVNINAAVALPNLTVTLEGRQTGTATYQDSLVTIINGQTVDLRYSHSPSTSAANPISCTLTDSNGVSILTPTANAGGISPRAFTTTTILRYRCVRGSDAVFKELPIIVTAQPIAVLSTTGGNSFDYGSVTVGQTKDLSFTVTNTGNANATNIRSGTAPDQFTLLNLAANCSGTVAPGGTCTFSIRYAPTAAGTISAQFPILYNEGTTVKTHAITLNGSSVNQVAPNGLDATFGTLGKMQTNSSLYMTNGSLTDPSGIITQVVGGITKYLVFGSGKVSSTAPIIKDAFSIVRLNSNGSIDTSFGTNGLILTEFSESSYISRLLIQPDGKIVAVGGVGISYGTSHVARIALARFSANGTLDSTFGANGKVEHSIGNLAYGTDGALTPDGKIVVIARHMFNLTSSLGGVGSGIYVARYTSTGALDSTFGTGGVAQHNITRGGGTYNFPAQVAVLADGKIIIAAVNECSPNALNSMKLSVVRLLVTGAIDSSFGASNGVTCAGNAGSNVYLQNLFIYNNELITVGYPTSSTATVTRFTSTGSVISSFNASNIYLRRSSIAPNGNILLTGFTDTSIAKLFSITNGTVVKSYEAAGFSGRASAGIVQSDNKVVIIGNVINGTNQLFMSRYLP